MSCVIIAGGTGLIGRRLGFALKERGYKVIVLSRRSISFSFGEVKKWDGVHVPSDLVKEPILAFVNLAGASIAERRWTSAYKQVLWESRVNTTEGIVEWLREYRPEVRLLSASAIGFYGATLLQEELTEESPSGEDFLAGLVQAWEGAAQKAPQSPLIFRIGIVLSPEGGAWPRFLGAFRWGIGFYFAPGQQGFSWIHIEDVVKAFIWGIENPEKRGVYNLTAPEPVSAKKFAKAIGKMRGTHLLLPLPEALLKGVLGERAKLLTRGAYVKPARLLTEGFSFKYPTLHAALGALLRS
ncbi:MAG: TIGR01777 family oxidoreductase [Bacteroidia bacterium]|nr:TIGR01777 family oxidoreductase [Bacteroidia bacterium]MDW8133580.1 TIGR01777 family oxidoreductase [Bacteroidia bacterium]